MGTPVGDRMEKMRARKIAAGLRQVNVWVPADQVEAVRRFSAELVTGKPAEPLSVDLEAPVQLLATFIKKPSYEDRDMLKKQGWKWDGEAWTIITPVRLIVSTAFMLRECLESYPVITIVRPVP
jgi:hypothetical protein